ncbi:WHG domain-containing protein [Faecalicatena sp. AGMB00832]|uniref:WHG domain-containing protein n=1 Tax=Faecalicatena faecalis TaxID=2726362 RepID=A0ABS6D5D3_9FIRM|nr:TetR/AcrR family transcriptional regulator [Faecalicatena faecalis]MBU3876813.1 WHG domain-containing protein [Faecalicatena faecalis]
MARAGLDKNVVVEKAAQLANKIGLESITLKILADSLNVQPPSLYNHIRGLDDIKNELMLYGWRHMEERMLEAAVGVSGYDAWEAICRAFYDYATENPGVFSAMLWYNKYQNNEAEKVTQRLFAICSKITSSLNISEENCNHLIRTFRAFLEGFSLLVNNDAFGHSLPVEDSFEFSLKVLTAGMKELEEKNI